MTNKKKRIITISAICGVVVLIVAIIVLLPYMEKLTGKNKAPDGDSVSVSQNEIVDTTNKKPLVTNNKGYAILVDITAFTSTETEDGITTITSKDNDKVKMTITPLNDVSYDNLCLDTIAFYGEMGESAALDIGSKNSAYRSQTGDKADDIITTVYCVDNGKGGSIEIRYETPVSAKDYSEDFETMLSMFTVK